VPDISEDIRETDAQIAAVRANIRELIDQATGHSGAADDELVSRRIAEQEARLIALTNRRAALGG
jgi:hypothetical protein